MASADLRYHWWGGPGSGRVNQATDDALREAFRLFRKTYTRVPLPRMTQGGMFGLGGGADASAGTHDGGGTADFISGDFSRLQYLHFVTCLRLVGFAAWLRPYVEGLWPTHVHLVRIGDDSLSKGAYNQTVDFKNGLTGLASKRKDTLHEWVGWTTWEKYSAAQIPRTEFFGMSGKHHSSRLETKIIPGVEVVLPINDEGDVSLLAGPVADYYIGGNIRIANLPPGQVLRIYASQWYYKAGSVSELISKGLQQEIVGTTGNTYTGFSFDGEIGKSSKAGWSRRLRLLAETDSPGLESPVMVTRLLTTVRK
jgi:hypothetical protein